jgi:hypothetical protein
MNETETNATPAPVHAEGPIEVHVYGALARRLSERSARHERVIHIEPCPDETLGSLLMRLDIRIEELATVFLNGSLVATRNAMAPWLRYPQARDDVWDWDADVALSPGDRVGLFGDDMALLVV